MTPGRAFSLLTGIAVLAAIARFNEMTPAAQASLLDGAAATAQSFLHGALATYDAMTGNGTTGTAGRQPSGPVPSDLRPPGADGQKAADAPQPRGGPHVADAAADSGNPLWALPLTQLSNTRERPIFSPSRRPPPRPTIVAPVAIQQPVKPPEPARPTVSLLGTIIGTNADDRIAVFLEAGTLNIVRLRIGDDHQGWVLRLVKAREATLVKDSDPVVLEMPPPGEPPPPGLAGIGMPAMPPAGVPAAKLATPAPPPAGRQRQPRR
jgi:general secretion pathway protein N